VRRRLSDLDRHLSPGSRPESDRLFGQLTQATPPPGSPTGASSITYDGELDGSSVSYGYNALNRLTSDIRTGTTPTSHTYTYDLAGNATLVNEAKIAYGTDSISVPNSNSSAFTLLKVGMVGVSKAKIPTTQHPFGLWQKKPIATPGYGSLLHGFE
jgi:YD repeat-containing protein